MKAFSGLTSSPAEKSCLNHVLLFCPTFKFRFIKIKFKSLLGPVRCSELTAWSGSLVSPSLRFEVKCALFIAGESNWLIRIMGITCILASLELCPEGRKFKSYTHSPSPIAITMMIIIIYLIAIVRLLLMNYSSETGHFDKRVLVTVAY